MRRDLTLSEIGIGAVAGSYENPWAWLQKRPHPLTRASVSAEQIGEGIYWSEVSFDANPADPPHSSPTG